MKNLLVEQLTVVAEVKQAASYQQKQEACILTGLGGSSKPVFCVALDKILGEKGSIAFLVASREEIRVYRRELNYFYPDLPMQELYPVNLPRVQADTQSLEVQAGRAAALRFLQGEERGMVFITAEALQQKQFVPRSFNKNLVISLGEEREQHDVIAALVALGYERTAQVDAIGQFCLRGDILDVFPINSNVAVRIEWFDNEIDAVRSFDINNQRSIQSLDEIKIAPLVMEESSECTASVFDYCVPSTIVVADEPVKIFELLEKLDKENKAHADELFNKEEIIEQCGKRALLVSALAHSFLRDVPSLNIPVRSVAPYNKNINMLTDDLEGWLHEGVTPIIMMSSSVKARGFADNLGNYKLPATYADEALQENAINVMYGDLDHGFRFWNENWILL
ncbi:MAG: transcription-repair coupling factor, partial [Phascolarctobacterium sp.]|nr:transcription-repair coupling factor [Phascolarctobacterium sp.]